jgi:GAF domain-containing protein
MTSEADALEFLRTLATRAEAARRLEAGGTQALLRSIVDATVSLFQAEAASIALYDAATDRLVFRIASGEQGQGVVGVSIPTSQGIAGFVYSTGQSLAISDVRQDPRFGRDVAESTGYVPRSLIAVPLVDDHGTIGVLEVLDKRNEATFSLQDVELAGVFARQAAIAISASRVERDVATLLSTAASTLLDGGAGQDVEEIVSRATAGLGGDDESRLWELADLVGRVRRADPTQLDLVVELLAVLARHAERTARRGHRAS